MAVIGTISVPSYDVLFANLPNEWREETNVSKLWWCSDCVPIAFKINILYKMSKLLDNFGYNLDTILTVIF